MIGGVGLVPALPFRRWEPRLIAVVGNSRKTVERTDCMHSAEYYRDQAARARRVAMIAHQPDVRDMLQRAAQDYDDIAEDIDAGAVEIRHAELLPQNYRS